MKDMNRVFYTRLISNAKYEIKNLDYLLIRATSGFFAEKSIDQAIDHLKKTQDHLIQAKKLYSDDINLSVRADILIDKF
jgi:prefoldin subunit 5